MFKGKCRYKHTKHGYYEKSGWIHTISRLQPNFHGSSMVNAKGKMVENPLGWRAPSWLFKGTIPRVPPFSLWIWWFQWKKSDLLYVSFFNRKTGGKPMDFTACHILIGDLQKTCVQAPRVSKPVGELLAVEVLCLELRFHWDTSSIVSDKISKMVDESCLELSSRMNVFSVYPKAHAPWTFRRGLWCFALGRIFGFFQISCQTNLEFWPWRIKH